jgi:hypothetical protein
LEAPTGFPGIGSDEFYSISYIPPAFPPTSPIVRLRATSFEDPSKFAEFTFTIVPRPIAASVESVAILGGFVAEAVPAVEPLTVDRNYYMPGASSQVFDIRRTTIVRTQVTGSGAGQTSGATAAIVSGGSVASLIPIPITPGYPGQSYYSLTRTGAAGGWVVVRATSVFNPAIYKEIAYYFKPQVFSIMALKQTWGPNPFGIAIGTSSNVLRIHNGGSPTQAVVVSSAVNCTVVPFLEPPIAVPAEVDPVSGRQTAVDFVMNPTGPYSITVHPAGNPSQSQTVTFTRDSQGFVVGQVAGSPFSFETTPYAPTSYSIAPAIPPTPPLTSNP